MFQFTLCWEFSVSCLPNFIADRTGNVGIIFALALIPVLTAAGAAVDYARASDARAHLQTAADAAAIAAASAPGLNDSERIAVARTFFTSVTASDAGNPAVSVAVSGNNISVNASLDVPTSLLGVVNVPKISVGVRSAAMRSFGGPPVCVLALNQTVSGAVTFAGNTTFQAADCAVYSNSSAGAGLTVQGSASVVAAGFCSVGGVSAPASLTPAPLTNCIRIDDPFAALPAAIPAANCLKTNYSLGPSGSDTLNPGTYCGGLEIKGHATLNPGLYIIKDGQLKITSQATVSGAGVTFYLRGSGAGFSINGGGAISLSAAASGAYMGLLIIQDRNSNVGATNTLNGNSTTMLTGALYTPTQGISVTGNGTFGQGDTSMPIIADRISFSGSSVVKLDVSALETARPLPRFASRVQLTQ